MRVLITSMKLILLEVDEILLTEVQCRGIVLSLSLREMNLIRK